MYFFAAATTCALGTRLCSWDNRPSSAKRPRVGSRGCSGFWIENGEIAYPVNEITVAGRIQDMLMSVEPASDLEFRSGTDAPTLAVGGLTVAGA